MRQTAMLFAFALALHCALLETLTRTRLSAQEFPAFPQSNPDDGARPSRPLNHAWTPSPDSLRNSSIQQNSHPAVVSSSYHRAVVSNGSAEEMDTDYGAGHATQLSNVRTSSQVHSVQPSANKAGLDSEVVDKKLTPLSPRSPANVKADSHGSSSFQMLLSVGSSLMVVIGLFIGCAWLYRKSLGRTSGSGLPKNVVQILGRTPVATRQNLVLLRFGSKLVLVSMMQGETRTISEITDPLEVDRLAGLCESSQPGSISSSFREILAQGIRS